MDGFTGVTKLKSSQTLRPLNEVTDTETLPAIAASFLLRLCDETVDAAPTCSRLLFWLLVAVRLKTHLS